MAGATTGDQVSCVPVHALCYYDVCSWLPFGLAMLPRANSVTVTDFHSGCHDAWLPFGLAIRATIRACHATWLPCYLAAIRACHDTWLPFRLAMLPRAVPVPASPLAPETLTRYRPWPRPSLTLDCPWPRPLAHFLLVFFLLFSSLFFTRSLYAGNPFVESAENILFFNISCKWLPAKMVTDQLCPGSTSRDFN